MFTCIHFQAQIETSRPQIVNLSFKKLPYQHRKALDRCSRNRKISDTHRQCINLFLKKMAWSCFQMTCYVFWFRPPRGCSFKILRFLSNFYSSYLVSEIYRNIDPHFNNPVSENILNPDLIPIHDLGVP